MDSSFSPKDGIWFLRVWHHISNAVYITRCKKTQRAVTHRNDKVLLLYFLDSTRYKYHINRYYYWICRFTTYGNSPSVPSRKIFYCVLINAGKRARQLSPHIHTVLLRFLWGEVRVSLRGGRAGGCRQLEPQSRRKISQPFSLSIDLLGSSPLRKHTAIPHAVLTLNWKDSSTDPYVI